ncbi:MAG: tetratricopeptide repeat protein [Nitrospirae bacterium]|nr:tetratricopeptide repeat protein [Nitrospirota bacterium]
MKTLFGIALLFTFLGVVAYLDWLNPGSVQVRLSDARSYELSLIQFGLTAFVLGGLVVLGMGGIREFRRLLRSWREARRHRAEQRVKEWLVLAINAEASGKRKEAIGWFEKILSLDPNHRTALIRLGALQRAQGVFQEALRLHRKAKSLGDRDMEAVLALVDDLEAIRRHDEAALVLREALAHDKDNRAAMIRLRDLCMELHQWEEAHGLQERFLKEMAGEEEPQERARLLGIKYEAGQQAMLQDSPDAARRHFRSAIKLDRNFVPAYIGLGRLLIGEGKPDQAVEVWRKAYWTTSSLVLLHRLEDLLLDAGDPAGVIDFYRQAMARDPGNPVLQFYLGKLYYRLEMIDEALELLAAIDTSNTRFPDLHKVLGNLYLRRGDRPAAVEEFKKALDLKKRVLVPYYCPHCDYHTTEWSGRCPRCEQWNSFLATPIITPRMKAAPPSEPSVYPAGEASGVSFRSLST